MPNGGNIVIKCNAKNSEIIYVLTCKCYCIDKS